MKQILFIVLLSIVLTSCEKFLEVGPNSNELDSEYVFENDETALAALNALYHELQNDGFASGNSSSLTFLGNTLADDAEEFSVTNDRYDFYTNRIRSDNNTNNNIWSSAYKRIHIINALLEGVSNNSSISKDLKNRIIGETKFIRSFIYYYLLHLYDEVPLVLSTDYKVNQSLKREPISKINDQIKDDLNDALKILPDDYNISEGQRVTPTKYAAYTLLSRVSLWLKDYESAIDYSDKVLHSGLFNLVELNEVFKPNSAESIWQLIPVKPNTGAAEGAVFILENNPATPNTAASSSLTEDLLSIWENGDQRFSNWINVYSEGNDDYYYPFKYKIKSGGDTEEYSMVMRLAEVYLIRAEAYAMQGEVTKAITDLNVIRNRAGLPDLMVNDITDIQDNVLEERRRELFSEWGHRWLDLKRFGKLDEVLGNKKTDWSERAKLLPIPEQDILRNPFLTQNPGY